MNYIEPTRSSRRNLAIILVVALLMLFPVTVFRDELVAAANARLGAMPPCDSAAIFKWVTLGFVGFGLIVAAWVAWLARKSLKLDQWPLPGTWVLHRTPIRRGWSVRWRAYAVFSLAIAMVVLAVRVAHGVENFMDRARARHCPNQISM